MYAPVIRQNLDFQLFVRSKMIWSSCSFSWYWRKYWPLYFSSQNWKAICIWWSYDVHYFWNVFWTLTTLTTINITTQQIKNIRFKLQTSTYCHNDVWHYWYRSWFLFMFNDISIHVVVIIVKLLTIADYNFLPWSGKQ